MANRRFRQTKQMRNEEEGGTHSDLLKDAYPATTDAGDTQSYDGSKSEYSKPGYAAKPHDKFRNKRQMRTEEEITGLHKAVEETYQDS